MNLNDISVLAANNIWDYGGLVNFCWVLIIIIFCYAFVILVVVRGCAGIAGWFLFLFYAVLAGLAFMFSSSILLQILACAIYGNWWPMLSALMHVLVPMPCLFFGGGST
ncbi:uncharacterized protein LOC142608741 [Castanea sativa]|uniref:uncharacterized protein LOC142608741 n=1 Tax=Castanea sativa TaxID=21020 RepID=UPI003F64D83D